MNFTVESLMLGVVFGSLGMGYWVYGKKEAKAMPLLAGAALMVFPYFVTGVWWTIVVGVLISAVPFFIRV